MLNSFWLEFLNHFKSALAGTPPIVLDKAWGSQTSRTTFYKEALATHVARAMKLEFVPELFKVDFTLGRRSGESLVPLIFVESENNAQSASHEMRKLCCLSAPLKVLITCVEWSEEPGYWKSGGSKSKLMHEWTSIISEHNRVWAQPCVYGIVVGERNGTKLRFYANAIAVDGKAGDETVAFSFDFASKPVVLA